MHNCTYNCWNAVVGNTKHRLLALIASAALLLLILTSCGAETVPQAATENIAITLEERLNTLPASSIEEISNQLVPLSNLGLTNIDAHFDNTYKIMLTQPLDHNNSELGSFEQKIYLSYVDPDAPVVLVTEGYFSQMQVHELSAILECNQIIVEHRYFGESKPDPTDWQYLNTYQAASDIHNIIELFKPVLKGKWLTTGISKGGIASCYHSYYYPDDVDVRVPYVAPLQFTLEDERIDEFLENVGTEECRQKIRDYQVQLLEQRAKLLPHMKADAEAYGWTFDRVGGIDRAYELSVLEFGFRFWVWGGACDDIPLDGNAKAKYGYLDNIMQVKKFTDQELEIYDSYVYQAMTELGFYDFSLDDFAGLLEHLDPETDHVFSFRVPTDAATEFNYGLNLLVQDYLSFQGNNFLYLYGGNDTWTATAVEIDEDHTNAVKIVQPSGDHKIKIVDLDPALQNRALSVLADWLACDADMLQSKTSSIKDNLFTGEGSHEWSNNSYYEGEWKNGMQHGYGTMTWADGAEYTGEWKDSKMHGYGSYMGLNGYKYTGDYIEDKFHGKGEITWPSGNKYTGDFYNGQPHGYGTYRWTNGNWYTGAVKEDKRHGYGTLVAANGDKYTGSFYNSQFHGQGKLTYADGYTVEGQWSHGKYLDN